MRTRRVAVLAALALALIGERAAAPRDPVPPPPPTSISRDLDGMTPALSALGHAPSRPPSPSARGVLSLVRPDLVPAPVPVRLQLDISYYDEHADRVRRDLLMFGPDLTSLDPPPLDGERLRLQSTSATSATFVSLPDTDDPLALARDRDHLLLWQPGRSIGSSLSFGMSLFSGLMVMSAHAPQPFRFLFDRQLHFGPAIFYDGGMGAGLAAWF